MEVKQDENNRAAFLALHQGMNKSDVKKLPSAPGAKWHLSVWKHLGIMDDKPDSLMLFEGHCILVPFQAQRKVLHLLHLPHMGLVGKKMCITAS